MISPRSFALGLLTLGLGIIPESKMAQAQWIPPSPVHPGQVQLQGARQTTLFAIVADPKNQAIDPKLKPIEAQLKRLLPNHGFKLLDSKTQRLVPGGPGLICKIDPKLGAKAELVTPLNIDGKIEFRFSLITPAGLSVVSTVVSTPPNQLCFYDKVLPDGQRLLIGIGAR